MACTIIKVVGKLISIPGEKPRRNKDYPFREKISSLEKNSVKWVILHRETK